MIGAVSYNCSADSLYILVDTAVKRIIFWQSSYAFGVSGENNMARGWLDLLSQNNLVLDRVKPALPGSGTRRRKPLSGHLLNLSEMEKLSQDIDTFRPDFVFFGNLNSITPAALHVARKNKVKSICIFHNWRAVCANGLLFRDGHFCNECPKSGSSMPAVVHRCAGNDSLASAIGIDVHKFVRSYDLADAILVPSAYMIEEFRKAGLVNCHFRHFPNWLNEPLTFPAAPRKGAIFAGALSTNKGILPLVDAWLKCYSQIGERLHVFGEGTLRPRIEEIARNSDAIVFEGPVERSALLRRISQARVTIVPSVSLESFGLVAIESMSVGTPLITGVIGGLSEINSAATGVRIASMSPEALLSAYRQIDDNWLQFSRSAVDRFESHYSVSSARTNLAALLESLE